MSKGICQTSFSPHCPNIGVGSTPKNCQPSPNGNFSHWRKNVVRYSPRCEPGDSPKWLTVNADRCRTVLPFFGLKVTCVLYRTGLGFCAALSAGLGALGWINYGIWEPSFNKNRSIFWRKVFNVGIGLLTAAFVFLIFTPASLALGPACATPDLWPSSPWQHRRSRQSKGSTVVTNIGFPPPWNNGTGN